MSKYEVKWAYGVTTVWTARTVNEITVQRPDRRDILLPRTLASLAAGGFDKPRLFVDGLGTEHDGGASAYYRKFGLEVTARWPTIRTYGNWILGLAEIFLRDPMAHRFAMFQDDIIVCKNLRQYLDKVEHPKNGYWNLYTDPINQALCPLDKTVRQEPIRGFYESNQRGRGALALVFAREAVITLLTHHHMVERPLHATRGWRSIDGGIMETFRKVGGKEYVHNPSLVQHTGTNGSSMGNGPQPLCTNFPGEQFDCLSLLPK